MVFVLLLNIFLFLVNQESALKVSCWGDFLPRNQISKEKKLYNEKKSWANHQYLGSSEKIYL